MNGATLAVFVLALLSFVPIAQGSQQVPQLTPFLDIDFDWPRSKDNKFELAQGAIVQITVERSAYVKEPGAIQAVIVEVAGESVTKVCVADTRWRVILGTDVLSGSSNRHFHCLFKAVKRGISKVRITPIGVDGTIQQSQEWTFKVGDGEPKKLEFRPIQGNPKVREPQNMLQINIDHPIPKTKTPHLVYQTGFVRVSAVRPGDKDRRKALKMLKVEVTGDALVNLGVVDIPIRARDKKGEYVSKTHSHLAALLHAAKPGLATVKVTPIGVDGTEYPTLEYRIEVGAVGLLDKDKDAEKPR